MYGDALIAEILRRQLQDADKDFFATSSDILRLYFLRQNEESGKYEFYENRIEFRNQTEFCQPITSFDWNQFDQNTIVTASLDTSVTIWNIEH